jgi:hypothetical protein
MQNSLRNRLKNSLSVSQPVLGQNSLTVLLQNSWQNGFAVSQQNPYWEIITQQAGHLLGAGHANNCLRSMCQPNGLVIIT